MVEAADLFLVVFEEFGTEVHSIEGKAAFGVLYSPSFYVHCAGTSKIEIF
jgi:hypothetical protein